MTINLADAAQAGFGGLADVPLAVAMANTNVHGYHDTQLRIIVN